MAYGPDSTTDEVLDGIDLTGHLALVTGASAGLGQETSRALASHGARVVMGARDLAKGEAARAAIRETVPDADLELREVDLASLASIRAFTDAFLAEHDRLDILVANAGVMACPFDRTADGFEMQFGTNHIGHFLLVNRLAPTLVAAARRRGAPSRVVVLSSRGHQMSDVDLDDHAFERTPYDKWSGYGRSKTANVLFAIGFDARHRDRGVRAFAVHPGTILTELGRHMGREDLEELQRRRPGGAAMQFKTVEAGAATQVWAATAPELEGRGALYLEDCRIADVIDAPGTEGVLRYAVDPARADALWARSEELVGERFAATA
jgi:NAD(P)-dependent dehydrogenase (short-subunit alcohol dehydrogenase family)